MSSGEELSGDLARETAVLRRIARGIVLEPALAEDAVQEAWLAALRAGPQALSSGGWLTQAVRRIASGLKRRQARQARRERAGARRELLPSAADTAARVELLRELLGALESLDEPYRTAVQLRLVDDLPPREIAVRTGVPVETARTRVKRGVERLRAQLDARHATRRGEFLALLAPLAGFDPLELGMGAALGAEAVFGGTVMSLKVKLGVAAALALAAGLFIWRDAWVEPSRSSARDVAAGPPTPERVEVAAQTQSSEPAPAASDAQNAASPVRSNVVSAPERSWVARGRAVDQKLRGVSGVDVRVRAKAGYEGEGEVLAELIVRTDSNGSFEAALEPPNAAALVSFLVVSEHHFPGSASTVATSGKPAPQEVLLRCTQLDVALRGRVLDTDGAPLEGVVVSGYRRGKPSDSQGRFELRAASALEEITLRVQHKGFAPAELNVHTMATAGPIEGLEIVLSRGAVLRGRVLDDERRPIASARVQAFNADDLAVTSDELGRFELDSLPADQSWIGVAVEAKGFARTRVDFDDGRLPADELEVVLRRGVDISGVVTDEHGAPLPGARLTIGARRLDADGARGVSREDGAFTLRDVAPRKARMWVDCEGYAPLTTPIDPQLIRAPLVLAMVRGVTVSGRSLDEHGEALAGVTLTLREDGNYLDHRARSDEHGRFEIRGVPERANLELECYAAGRVRTRVALAADRSDVEVTLARAAGLCGRVVDASSGDPVQRFRVRFIDTQVQPGEKALTGVNATWYFGGREFSAEDGRWSMEGEEVPAGMIAAIEVTAAGFAPALVERAVTSLDPQSQPIEVALQAPARLLGRVIDSDVGAPLANAVLRVVRVHGPSTRAVDEDAPRAHTNANGEFELRELSSDAIWLVADAAGYARRIAGPFEPTPSTAPVTIEMNRGATLRGVLLDAAGTPLAGETIMVSLQDARTGEHLDWNIPTDVGGRFELAHLSPGEHQVARRLQRDQRGIYDLSRFVSIGERGDYEVELRPRGAIRVRGRVNSGATSFDGTVSAWSLDDERHSRMAFVVDSQFELDGMTEGRWRFSVFEHGRGGVARHGQVELQLAAGADAVVEITTSGR